MNSSTAEIEKDLFISNKVDLFGGHDYYKIDDLRVISKQLHLPTENVKKQQLYDSIHNVLSKLNI